MAVITYSQVDERYSNQEQRDAARKLIAAGRFGLGLFVLALVVLGVKTATQSNGANPADTTALTLFIAFLLFLFVYLPSVGVRNLGSKKIVKLSVAVGTLGSVMLKPGIVGILCMVRYIKAAAALKHYEPFYEETGDNDDVQVADVKDNQSPTLLRKLLRKRLSSIFAVLYTLGIFTMTTAVVIARSQGKKADANMQGVYLIFALVFALASGISAIVEIFTAKAGKRLRAAGHLLCVLGFGILVLAATFGVLAILDQVYPGTDAANVSNGATHTTRDKYDEGSPDATEILELVNQERQSKGVSPLAVDERLVASAREKAEDMAARSYLKHDNPEGVPGTELVFKHTGDLCRYGGESIQFSPGEEVTSRMVVNSWKESKPHHDGMLNGKYLLTGIYVKQGTYAASDGYYSVQHFCQIEQ